MLNRRRLFGLVGAIVLAPSVKPIPKAGRTIRVTFPRDFKVVDRNRLTPLKPLRWDFRAEEFTGLNVLGHETWTT
jgi:hypothetical protein